MTNKQNEKKPHTWEESRTRRTLAKLFVDTTLILPAKKAYKH